MKSKYKFVPSQVVPMFEGGPMNTNDLNARSSLTKRQRRSQAPRVECLESRELLTYPAVAVQGLVNQALFAHRNTAFQTVALVDTGLKIDLGATGLPGTPLTVFNNAVIATGGVVTFAASQNLIEGVGGVVNQYLASATAPAGTLGSLARFPSVEGQIAAHALGIVNSITLQNIAFVGLGVTTNAAYVVAVNDIITAS